MDVAETTLQFFGAVGTVTGSRALLKVADTSILLDCGLFQGPRELREKNWLVQDFDARKIDAVVLTHAHLDHSGYLPRLVKQGFSGPVYCSVGTSKLLSLVLRDSARLQAEDSDYANRTGHSRHKPALPLYDEADVEMLLKLVRPIRRNQWTALSKRVSFELRRAGHIVGASHVVFDVNMGQSSRKICFSGDVGRPNAWLLKAPDQGLEADVVILESTYGNRMHPTTNSIQDLAAVLKRVLNRGGVAVLPAFAIGRAQDLLFAISFAEKQGWMPSYPVILDSPMSSQATEIFVHDKEDSKLSSAFGTGQGSLFPKFFETAESTDESMLACMRDGPMVIVSASGMLSGGRVLHHLRERLPEEKNAVVFCGFQAEGTKGHFLQHARRNQDVLRVHHKEVPVNAEIVTLEGFSAHADQRELLDWLAGFRRLPKHVLLNHGESLAQTEFKKVLETRFPEIEIQIPQMNEKFQLLSSGSIQKI